MISLTGNYTLEMQQAASIAFELLKLNGEAELEVDILNINEMAELNNSSRGISHETDVLSFPMINEVKDFTKANYPFDYNTETNRVSIGLIVICDEVAKRQAEEFGHSILREKTYLFVHGLLHVLGYDHLTEDDKKEMRKEEELIMSSLGIER
ncbi:MAG: rRNA maturation RNase YbeY [Clostridia bacterium]|nr:rRNA maturation RNase YbeY [Clostridia bacterium]